MITKTTLSIVMILSISILMLSMYSAEAAFHPIVKIVNPQDGDVVSGKLIIQVQITNVCLEDYHYGAGVTLFLDDKKFKGKGKFVSSQGSYPNCVELYKWDWGTGNKDNGEHTMIAKASYGGGWIFHYSDPVTVTVENTKGNK